MNLKPGDKINLKSYNEVVDMYKNNEIGRLLDAQYPTNSNFIYGIEWDVYKEICNKTGIVEEKAFNNDYFFVDFGGEYFRYFIPKMLIKSNKAIDLPDILFEL